MEKQNFSADLIKALRMFSENPAAIDNFESYLSNCFDAWRAAFAATPEGLVSDLLHFANID